MVQLILADEAVTKAKCGAGMFGHGFHMALARFPESREIFDRFCERVTNSGLTLTEAFRVWFYQYHVLRTRTVKEEHLEELLLKTA